MTKKPPNWEEDSAALEKLFRSLPIERGAAENIPYESLISNIPDELLLMRPASKKKRPRSAGAKKTLHVLVQSTRRTINALEALSPKVLAPGRRRRTPARHSDDSGSGGSGCRQARAQTILNYRPAALRKLITSLKFLEEEAAKIKTKLPPGRPKQDRPNQAKSIAHVTARHYHGLTGKKATRYNAEFVSLLEGVYKILGLEASAVARAATLLHKERAPAG
jgi:hypothetical protein